MRLEVSNLVLSNADIVVEEPAIASTGGEDMLVPAYGDVSS
jgi:hypothetical protein